jgi:GGDEF domain-containing protein
VLVIPNGTDGTRKRRTRQIRARVVTRHFECGGESVTLTLSMGTFIREPNPVGTEVNTREVADDILRRTGMALDRAKKQGGDQVADDNGSEG